MPQERPTGLSSAVTFVGILPEFPVFEFAWNPEGTLLAYAVDAPGETSRRTVNVRALPTWELRQSWAPPGPAYHLVWRPDSRQLAFTVSKGQVEAHIWLVQLGTTDWQELDPGEAARQLVSVRWLDSSSLFLMSGCGTSCDDTYLLRIPDGTVDSLRNLWQTPSDGMVLGNEIAFSPDQQWFAAENYGHGFPRTVLVRWDDIDTAIPLATGLNTRYTSAESWTGSTLAFVAYPPGEVNTWPSPPQPELRIWDLSSGEKRLVGRGSFLARFSPQGDRLAAVFVGEPQTQADGTVQSVGTQFCLALLDWPSGKLLSYYPLGGKNLESAWDVRNLPAPRWSLEGEWLAFELPAGGLALMDRDGQVQQVLSGRRLGWAEPYPGFDEPPVYWGANGYLAMLVEGRIWIVRAPVRQG